MLLSDSIDPAGGRHVVQITFAAEIVGCDAETTWDPRVVGIDRVRPEDLEALDLRPPLAEALVRIVRATSSQPAEYLGPLWTNADKET